MFFLSKLDIENHIENIIKNVFKNRDDINSYSEFGEIIKNNKLGIIEVTKNKTHVNIYFKNCIYNTKLLLKQVNVEKECVVCYENTNTRTSCNHFLCEDCVNDIFKHTQKYNCPYCRSDQKLNGYKIDLPIKAIKILFL